MTNRVSRVGVRSTVLAVCFFWTTLAASAVVHPPPASPYDGDTGTPAAPEPAQILMLSGGLALVGGFISYHMIRRRH